MASQAYLESLLAGITPDLRRRFRPIFAALLRSLRFGPPTSGQSSTNFKAVYLSGTTSSSANTEFIIRHGLGIAPYMAIPVIPLGEEGAKLVDLTVTRATDATFIYLSSSVTSAPFTLLVEA